MARVKSRGRLAVAVALSALLSQASTARAGGFALHEAGGRGTLFGGAFAAQASDLSAMFYNPAGVAANDTFSAMGGLALIPYSASMDGANPFPGATYSADMQFQIFYPPHLYAAYPISKGFNVAFGVWSPYGLSTSWDDPDFRGRFLSQRVDLRHFAVGLQLSYQLTDWLAIGGGPELRLSDVKLQRNAGTNNPFTNRFVDIAHIDIVSDGFDNGWAWGAGIQLKPAKGLRIGGSYHAAVDIDYKGAATFYPISTGNAQLDAVLATRLPFNTKVPVATTIQFPSLTMLGLSYEITPKITAEFDAYYTTWNVFDKTVLHFDTVDGKTVPESVLPHDWHNSWRYSGGINFQITDKLNAGVGAVYDQTPQPDEDVSPLLPDANRTGVIFGGGFKLGAKTSVDVSNMLLFFHDRSTNGHQDDNFNGTYKTFADLLTISLRHSF